MRKVFDKMFSVTGIMITSIFVAFLISLYYEVNLQVFLVVLGLSQLATFKILFSLSIMKGHPALAESKCKHKSLQYWCLKIFKAPIRILVVMGAFSCMVFIAAYGLFIDPSNDNCKALAVSLGISEIITFLHWIFHWKEYYYCLLYTS